MDKKTLLLLIIGIIITFVLGFGGVWLLLGGDQPQKEKKENPSAAHKEKDSKKEAMLTSTVDFFELSLPCKTTAEGNTPIVHADFQLVVPLKYRVKIETNTSRVHDIIATLMRNSDVNEINRDNLAGLKQQIIDETKKSLGVEINEVLVQRFNYDILKLRK